MVMLRVISGGKPAGANTTSYDAVRAQLRKVLKAKLTPTLTVEDACHLYIFEDGVKHPPMEEFMANVRELHAAGLSINLGLDELPEGIVLASAAKFKAKFPDLATVIPVMEAHQGVQPYTDGLPRAWPQPYSPESNLTLVK